MKGITIIYISHRLDEVFQICNNVTVLRDGMHIDTRPVADVTKKQLISMMVGREMGQEFPKEKAEIGEVVLEVKNLNRGKVLKDISFSVRKGEVFGISAWLVLGVRNWQGLFWALTALIRANICPRKINYRTFEDAIRTVLD